MSIVFDTGEDGLQTFLTDWKETAIRKVFESERPLTSKDVWIRTNMELKDERSISRASIINFLNYMSELGVLDYVEETGKGGYHRRYSPRLDEAGLKSFVASSVISKLIEIWPHETWKILEENFRKRSEG